MWNWAKNKKILKYSKKIVAIDILEESVNKAKNDIPQVKFLVRDASKLDFDDKSFDVIITTDSFHEISPKLQNKVLNEITRLANTIIFIEPDEISVTNELFKVFDPNENHSLRIKNSMNKIFMHMNQNNYKLIDHNYYEDKRKFKNEYEMYEVILSWWNDIKIPSDDIEKQKMIDEIKDILVKFNMLDKLEIFEYIHYYVYMKEE